MTKMKKFLVGLTTATGEPGFLRIAPIRGILTFHAVTEFMEASRFATRSSAMRILDANKDQIALLGVTDLPTTKHQLKVLGGGETIGFNAGDPHYNRKVRNAAPFTVESQDGITENGFSPETLAAMQEDGLDPADANEFGAPKSAGDGDVDSGDESGDAESGDEANDSEDTHEGDED